MTFGSLFAGIGGIDLGLERAGMRCLWQVECDPYCLRVLAKHWPDVRRWDEVRTFPPDETWEAPDLICGGFPCQDLSYAGKGAGIEGARSGLWSEFARIIRHLRPRFVLVENVPALLGRGLGRVLGDLAEGGYDAEWDCLPAASIGAPHRRDRVFVVAYAADSLRWTHRRDVGRSEGAGRPEAQAGEVCEGLRVASDDGPTEGGSPLAFPGSGGRDGQPREQGQGPAGRGRLGEGCEDVALPEGARLQGGQQQPRPADPCEVVATRSSASVADASGRGTSADQQRGRGNGAQCGREAVADAQGQPLGAGLRTVFAGRQWRGRLGDFRREVGAAQWAVEPDVDRVAHGVPSRVHRLRGLGNAVVPQVAEFIGRRIMEAA